MTSGYVSCPVPDHNAGASSPMGARSRSRGRAGILGLVVGVLILWLATMSLPLMADGTNAAPAQPTAAGSEDFGQYMADHQEDIAPFFKKNAEDLFRQAIPMVMGMMGGVIILTMLVGWGIDVLMSRGFAFFFAPAFSDLKRSVLYATGRLFLSFVYTGLMGLGIVFSLGMPHSGVIIGVVVALLLIVALAAQIVWILYLYRTDFVISVGFYLAVLLAHGIGGFLIAKPILGSHAPSAATNFVDTEITSRLKAEVASTKQEVAAVQSTRDSASAKVTDFQNQIAQSQAEAERLQKEIEEKKNSDIYVFGQIVKVRAEGDLNSTRDQMTSFLTKFPSSPLTASIRQQLAEVNNQLAIKDAQKKQEEADAARVEAQARADLLARAGKGEVTLSEMRQALIGKTRVQVSDLLGPPSETASDSWGYRQQMIVNPLTNEKHGLLVYFTEGIVQSVDYDRNGGSR